MAQPQYFEVLKQDDKNTGQQQFYTNVEDQTVQYVITPNKTQVQYPTTPIVVATGDQLMVVNAPPQQIVIDPSSITYQDPEVQQQLQQPRQQMKPALRVPNQNQPVRQLTPGIVQQRPIQLPSLQSINKPSNPLQRTSGPIQLHLKQPLSIPRSMGNSLQVNSPKSQGIQQLQQTNSSLEARSTVPGQQIRLSTAVTQQRPNIQLRNAPMLNTRFQLQQTQQLQVSSSQEGDIESSDLKSSDDHEAVTLPNGSVVSVSTYKKMLGEQKARNTPQKNLLNQSTQQNEQTTQSPLITSATNPPTSRKRNTTPRNPRQPPRGGARSTGKGRNQTPKASPQTLQGKETPQFSTVNQQQNKPQTYQNTQPNMPQNQLPSQQEQLQQQVQQVQQQQQMQQQQMQQQQLQQQQLQQQIQQQLQQHLQQQQLQPFPRPSQANYVIQPPRPNQKPLSQRPLPAYIPSSQIQKIIESTPISEEFSDSIRMLVLLENGEQRLITFTLPKEACTIQEILEQVNVPFQSNTNIQVTEANSNGINYIVTVGNVPPLGYEEDESHSQSQEELTSVAQMAVQHASQSQQQLQQQHPQHPQLQPQQVQQQQVATTCPVVLQQPVETSKPPSPEPIRESPKLVPGMLALCGACGYLSEDFARCIRCQRKLPDNVKSIQAPAGGANGRKKNLQVGQLQQLHAMPSQQSQPQLLQPSLLQQPTLQQPQPQIKNTPVPTNPGKPVSPTKKKNTKNKSSEQESVVISSDEEEDEKPAGLSENILQKLGNSVTISPITKEPSSNDIKRHSPSKVAASTSNVEQEKSDIYKTKLNCRTVRIGSYRCVPTEEIIIDSHQVVIKVPHPKDKNIKTLKFDRSEIVKILASFNSSLPVLFYYLDLSAAEKIREVLDMTTESNHYFDPLSMEDEAHRRITLLPDDFEENDRNIFQLIYPSSLNILEELNVKEANDILIKTCPKDLAKNAIAFGSFTEIQKLVMYPPEGRGRISINTEDYLCLGQDQFLNDVIIDFYLKYLVDHLPNEQKRRIHIFSTFFYKRLTTKPVKASRKSQPAELDPTLTSAQKRHARVKTWTKNVNLFEKDFVVVPINENAHWFLAIICFPGLEGCQTWDGKPYKLEAKSRSPKKVSIGTIGNVSVTAVKQEKVAKPIVCEDPEMSDKDEAEGDDSEMESDDSEELPSSQISQNLSASIPALSVAANPKTSKEPRPPIQQPCILIFDSLAGASRSRVVATLRDYLTCEYKAKLGQDKTFDKNVIKGANPKVPQQNNFTDCGLYVLQYVEQFFKDPIKDYHIPIKEIKNWFEEITVTKKREDIAILIQSLMKENGKDIRALPEIAFPTFNGKLVEREPDDEEDEEMMESENTFEEDEDMKEESFSTLDSTKSDLLLEAFPPVADNRSSPPLKPSNESISNDFKTQAVLNPKPDLSEFPRQTNKDTLSYLKAKRINRHKNADGPEMKKHKSDQ